MNIKVLGPGCAKCHQLEKVVDEVVREMGLDVKVEKVTNIKKIIMQYHILMPPGLVINEKLVASRKVPSKAEVTKYITNALAQK